MDEDLETPEAKKYFMEFMTDPDRNYCEGRFLSLAADLVRAGYKRRLVAQAGLNIAIEQALNDGPDYYELFMQRLGNHSKWAAEHLALDIAEAEKAAEAAK